MGETRQSTPFDENLRLSRSISTSLRTARLSITDAVTNDGFTRTPHMLLYHMNFGWPVVAADSVIQVGYELNGQYVAAGKPIARDSDSARGGNTWDQIGDPEPGRPEEVFRFDFPEEAKVIAEIRSPSAELGVVVSFNAKELPHLYLWKLLVDGAYVVGIEPANCAGIFGQAEARRQGILPFLGPGESTLYFLSMTLSKLR